MKWLLRIASVFTTLVVIFVVVGLCLPQDYHIKRQAVIDADRSTIHALVGDLDAWERWSVWKLHDPSLVMTPGTKTKGPGATLSWQGDQEGSDGRLVVLADDPNMGLTYELYFQQDQIQAQAGIRYEGPRGETTVTWEMWGDMQTPVLGGYVAPLMDSMIGPMFEEGLLLLKGQAEELQAGKPTRVE